MKQKKLNNILYVFDVNPYEITQDTDAEVIKVQEESYKGFVEMNQSLAEKIVKYNYHVMCVNTPEWAPYVDQEDPQEQLTFGIYGDSAADAINQIQVQNENNEVLYHWDAPDIQFPFQCNVEEGQHCAVECKEGVNLSALHVTGIEYLPVQWIDQETGHYWYATYPINESISIGITSAEITVTAPNGLSIYDEEQSTWVDVYQDGENPELEHGNLVVGRTYSVEQRSGIGENKNVYFVPLCGTGQLGTVGAEFIAPETDLTITLVEIEPSVTHTVTFNGCEFLNNIMEQTPDHQTVVATYDNLSSQETITVNEGNIIACTFGSGISMSAYDITPEGFFLGEWQNPDTLDYVAWSDQISDDANVTIATPQPQTYTVILEGGDIHSHATVKMNNETVPVEMYYYNVADGTVVDVYPTDNVADYSLISGAVWDTDHWTATVNGADLTITINYLGAGVNFVASWGDSTGPANVSEVVVCGHIVTGNDLTDPDWTETIYTHQDSRFVQYYVSTGLPTDMSTFEVDLDNGSGSETHVAYKQTNPDTGEVFYSDAADASGTTINNPGIWQYNNTPDSGLPWIGFTLPSTDTDGNPWVDNAGIKISADVSGS